MTQRIVKVPSPFDRYCIVGSTLVLSFFYVAYAEAGAPDDKTAEATIDLEYGEYLSNDCTSCHSLHIDRDKIIALAGLSEKFLNQTLRSYRAGERENQAMTTVAKSLSDDEIASVAAWLSRLQKEAQ